MSVFGELKGIMKGTRKHLMNGVSYMVPFVTAAGVLMALAVTMYGQGGIPPAESLPGQIWTIGAAGMGLMVPILSAYIAASIADRAGIAAGAVGGVIANNIGAGFLGGIISGFLAGIICYFLKKIRVPAVIRSVMPIIVIPIISVFLVCGIMLWGLGAPIAFVMNHLIDFMSSLTGGSKVMLGIADGFLSGVDMGGPFSKVAFAIANGTVSSGVYTFAGGNAVAVAAPPIGMALATFLAPKKYTAEEREAGKASLIMGCVGISEGAIPFAANDPLRVIPSLVIGDMVGATVAFLMNVTCQVAWGGLIVLPVIGNPVGFLIALASGSLVTALVVNAVKKPVAVQDEDKSDEDMEDIDLQFE